MGLYDILKAQLLSGSGGDSGGGSEQNVVFAEEITNPFDLHSSVVEMVIPEGVTALATTELMETASGFNDVYSAPSAFIGFPNLKKVTLPASMNPIKNPFADLTALSPDYDTYKLPRIEEIILSEGITEIKSQAFEWLTALKKVVFPSTLEKIEWDVFTGSALTEITIPSNVVSIDDYAFSMSDKLKKIIVNKPKDSIAGAPWGATKATIIWTG